jgi:hypothetical protein
VAVMRFFEYAVQILDDALASQAGYSRILCESSIRATFRDLGGPLQSATIPAGRPP